MLHDDPALLTLCICVCVTQTKVRPNYTRSPCWHCCPHFHSISLKNAWFANPLGSFKHMIQNELLFAGKNPGLRLSPPQSSPSRFFYLRTSWTSSANWGQTPFAFPNLQRFLSNFMRPGGNVSLVGLAALQRKNFYQILQKQCPPPDGKFFPPLPFLPASTKTTPGS